MNVITLSPSACGCNDTPRVAEMLRNCPDGIEIRFEKGHYDFYAEGAYTGYYCPVCNQSGDKQVIFPILRKKGITIDGSGSEFIFHDRVFPLIAQYTDGITLKNFSVDFSFPRYCIAKAHCREDGIFLEMDMQALHCSANADGNMIFKTGGTIFNTREKKFFMQQQNRVCFLAAGKLCYEPKNLPADVLLCFAEERKNGVFLRYNENCRSPFEDGPMVINYDEDRQNDIMLFDRCSDVRVCNVDILSGAGMGIVSQLCRNVELDHVRILPGKNGDQIYSTTADGLFFTQDSGRVWIHGCRVQSTMDDAVSIHNIYARVEAVLTENKVRVKYQHVSHSGFNPFVPGDVVQISDAETRNIKGNCTVLASHIENDTYSVLLECTENIESLMVPGDFLENHDHSPEVIIENTVFDNFPHIRLASAKKIIFRQNTVQKGIGICVNDLMRYWNAYGISDDVYLIGNKIINCEVGFSTVVERSDKCTEKMGRVHLQKNQFIDCPTAIMLCDTAEPILVDNSFIRVNERENLIRCGEVKRYSVRQLLMRRDTPATFARTPLPEGYSSFTFHRDGDERMSMEEYTRAWFRVCPHWSKAEFDFFYNDVKIPDDGFFLIRDEHGEAAAHSNVLLNEHKPGSATVHFVEVCPEDRGKRLGYCVSELVLDYVEKNRIPITYLTTDEFRMPAIKIYLRLGFRPVFWDSDMKDRWEPIMKILGYHEYYDEDEQLMTL